MIDAIRRQSLQEGGRMKRPNGTQRGPADVDSEIEPMDVTGFPGTGSARQTSGRWR